MNIRHIFIIIALTAIFLHTLAAQTDTTWREFYPIAVGNLWQYKGTGGGIGTVYVAALDTLMPNGQRYARMQSREYPNSFWFERVDTNGWIQYYAPTWGDTCGGHHELNYFRLRETVNSFWQICPNLIATLNPPPYFFQNGGIIFKNIFGQAREVMQFFPGVITETGDTMFYTHLRWWLVRGIGLYSDECYEGYYRYLQGAIINGVQYGTIVAVEGISETKHTSFSLTQNYPNPFNTSTIIQYDIPIASNVSLKVYNILGQEVARLVDKMQIPGRYQVVFNANNLASGVYIYMLSTGNQIM